MCTLSDAYGFVEEPQSFKIFFAKHNLSSFKFSTKVCERDMLVNTPILEAYGLSNSGNSCITHYASYQKTSSPLYTIIPYKTSTEYAVNQLQF